MLTNFREQQLLRHVQGMIDKSIEQSKRKPKKELETSSKQQILILHYLGFLDQIDSETTKKAILFSRLLNRNEQNIREFITYVNGRKIEESEIKTESNIKAVRKVFEDSEMNEVIELIDKDLAKLEKDF